MNNDPMPNNPKEEHLRQLLRSPNFPKNINEKVTEELIKALGLPRYLEVCKEEGADVLGFVEKAMQGSSELIKTLTKEHERVTELLKTENINEVGELLMAHLRLEYLIDQILLDNMKQYDDDSVLSKAKLSFFQKLCLLPAKRGSLSDIIPFLHEINKLRNAYAHNIQFKIENFRSDELDKMIERHKKLPSGEMSKFARVLDLIKVAEKNLLFETPEFRKKGGQILAENPELLEMIEIAKSWKR